MTKLYSLSSLQPRSIFKVLTACFFAVFLLVNSQEALAQCSSGANQGFHSFACNSEQSFTARQGDYYRFSIIDGISYNFNTRNTTYDTRIYARQTNNGGSVLFNQDSDNLSGNNESRDYTATYTGTIAVAIHYYWCSTWNGTSAIMRYKQNTTISNITNTSSICIGQTKTLSYVLGGAHDNPSVTWTVVSGSGSISGNTFTATAAGNVTVRGTVGVCSSDVTFTVLSNSGNPTSLTSNLNNVCPGTSVRLTANGGSLGAGAQYRFYTGGSCSGTIIYQGANNYVDVSPTSTSTYSVQIVGTCNTTVCRSTTVTVKTNSSNLTNVTKSTDNICPGASVTLTANGGSLGTGAQYRWYANSNCSGSPVASGSSSTLVVNPTSTTTYSVHISGDCNTTNCVNTTVNVTQTNSSGPSSLTSSSNPICSGDNITLNANGGTLGTGANYQWFTNASCSGSPFTTTGTSTLLQSPSSTTLYSVRITGTCNTTPCQATTVTVNSNVGSPSAPSGATQRCKGAGNNTYTSSASNATSYTWSLSPGSAGSISSSGVVTWNSSWTGTAQVTVTANGCGSSQSASTDVETFAVPVANAGSGGNECDLNFSLQAFPSVGSGTWTQQSGPGTTIFSNANSASSTATVTAYGTYVFRWTEVNGPCSNFDAVTVNFYEQPNSAAGGDQTTCGLTYTLAATDGVGTGSWAQVFGPGGSSFSSSSSATSSVTVTQAGTYVFRWTETNGICSDDDDVQITFVAQPSANAGSGGDECDLNFSFNASASVGTGTWTKQSGPGTASFNNANSTTATVTVGAYGTYVFRWTEVNGSCSDYDEITVNFYEQPVSSQGSGGNECDLDFVFNASTPGVGTGTWSKTSGPGTAIFINANSPTTTVAVSAYGTYVFTWTVVNGTCSAANNVTVNFYEQPIADAGSGGLECDLNFQLGATPSTGSGVWSLAGGAGIVNSWNPNSSDPDAIVTVSTYGTYFFQWTETNGVCSDDEVVQVLFNQVPTASITVAGSDTICSGDSTAINITLTGSSPWSVTYTDGGTPVTVNNIATSPYTFYGSTTDTYTLTNVTDQYSCVGTTSGSAAVFVNNLPVQPIITNLNGLNGFCQGLFTTLVASDDDGYVGYQWSPSGATTQAIAANVAGDYVVTATDTNGCSIASDTLSIVVYPNPVPVITPNGPTTFCQGDNVVLTSSAASTYDWSPTGDTTQAITVTTSGNYSVHVIDANGCEGTSSITQVTVNPNPTATVTPFGGSANGATTFCQGQDVLLLSSSGSSYLWSPGNQTTQIISVNSSGSYSVVVTDGNGCSTTSSPVTITVNSSSTPTISAGGPTTFCQGGSVTLTASSGNSYNWSTGATTQSITVTQSGNYAVTVTDVNNCGGGSAATTVTVNPLPTPTISASGPTTFCQGGNVTLTASSAASYLWSSGDTSQAINVASSGTYTVTVTDANGCTGTSSATTVTVNPLPSPTVSAGGATTFCAGGSVTLTSSSATGNIWSNGLVSQSITVTQSGNYYTTVTNGNGCSANSDTVTVTVNTNPTVSITPSGPVNFCSGSNVTLTASAGASYLWSSGDTTQSKLVTSSGTYTVTVTDANGCTGTASQAVTVYSNPTPTISTIGSTTFCQGGSVQLVSSAASAYSWSPGGATDQIIVVNTSGSYTVTVTDANGCTGTSSATTVTVNPLPTPTITPSGATTFCQGGSVNLTSSAGNAYAWSTGDTSQSINVTSSGTYTVTVTDGNGCSAASSATTVTVNPLPTPTISANGPLSFCDGDSVALSSSSAVSYNWSNGVTSQSFTTDTSGTFNVTVTDGNGCVGTSANTTVTVNPNPVATITPGGATTFCQGGSVTLTSSSATGNVWSTGVVSQSINVTQSGSYTVTVTSGAGCSTTSSPTVVTVNPNPTPVISSAGQNGACDGDTVLLFTNYTGGGHVWSPGGSTNDTLVATASGDYSVTYTDGNGCSATSATITINIGVPPQPVVTPLGPTTFCQGGSVTLFSSSSTGNTWSTGATTQFITVNTSGDYYVTVNNGCIGVSDTVTVTVNPLPTPTITPSSPTTFCQGDSVTLTASAGASYLWSTGASSQSITTLSSGTFTVTVTDANGCSAASSATSVTVNPLPTPTISASGPTTFCEGGSVTLTASAGNSYLWSNGVTTQSFSTDTSGTYSVIVTDANGCSASSSNTTVTVNPNPAPVITPSGPTTFCSGGSVTLTSSSATGNVWSTGVVSQSITVTQPGDYYVTVTDGNGCSTTSDTTTVSINNNPTPTISASGPLTFCNGDNVVLTSSASANYAWSSGDTTQSITVTSSGSFYVTVNDGNGCGGTSATVVVTVNSNPTPSITPLGATTFCQGQSVQLLSSASSQYSWSPNGETSQIIAATATGSYSVTVTDANGCSGTSSPISVTVNPLPTVSFSGLDPRYCLDAPTATLVGSPSGGTFSNPIVGSNFIPANAGVGTYNVTYTYTDGNSCTNIATQQVIVDTIPVVSFTGLDSEYCVDASAVTLTGSPAGGTFSGPGISGDDFDPSVAGAGTHSITYYFADGFGCDDSQTQTVVVNPLPVLSISGINSSYCEDGGLDTLAGVPSGGTFSGTGMFNNIFDPIDAGVGNHTVTYEYTDTNGCYNSVDSILEVNPLPVVNFTGLETEYCIDGTVDTLTGIPSGGTFSGTGISGNTFDPNAAGIGTHNITYTYTDANGCTNSVTISTEVVNLPTVSFAGLNLEYCVDESASTLTGIPSGGTFSGPGISGNSFDPAVAGQGTHTITYTYTDGFSCNNSISQQVVVNPLPVINFSGLASLYCISAPPAQLFSNPSSGGSFSGSGVILNTFEPAFAGIGTHTVTFNYTDTNGCSNSLSQQTEVVALPVVSFSGLDTAYCVNESNVTLVGSPAGGSFTGPGILSNTDIFSPALAGTGTHSIVYTYSDTNGCANTDTQMVNINGLPVISFSGLDPEYCFNGAFDVLIPSPAGGVFSGNGMNGNTFEPVTAGVGIHTVTYDYTDANGCAASTSQNVTVNALPTLAFTGLDPQYCVDASDVTLIATPFGGTFTGTGVSGDQFSPSQAGVGNHTITYTYTDANNCVGTDVQQVEVIATPNVSFTGLSGEYCVSALSSNLTGIPSGGTFGGPGITGNVFRPADAGVGTHVISYSFTNVDGCDDIAYDTVVVHPLPTPLISDLAGPYCIDDNTPVFMSGVPSGGIFDGPGVSGSSFTPSNAGVGTHFVTYSYTDVNGCTDSVNQSVVVNALPTVSFTGLSPEYCENDSTPVILAGTPSGGQFGGPGISGSTFTPANAGTGLHAITYSASDITGCASISTQSVFVNELPLVSFSGLAAHYCVENAPVTLTGTPAGGTFSGPGISGNSFNPGSAGVGFHAITYSYTDGNGCTNTSTQNVNVTQLAQPTVVANGPITFCEGDSLTLGVNSTYSGYEWSNNTFDPTLTVTSGATYAVTVFDSDGCSATSNVVTITVNPLPVVNLGPDISICPGELTVLSAGTGFSAYNWSTGDVSPTLEVSTDNLYWLEATNANGCKNRDSIVVSLYTPVEPVIQANGSPNICTGDQVTLDAGANFQSYAWSDNVTTTQTIDVSTTGVYTVQTVDQNGCEATSAPFVVNVVSLPSVPLYTNGPLDICEGEDLLISTNPGYASYTWTGSNSTTYDATVDSTGSYFVHVIDQNGCENTSIVLDVTSHPNPQPSISILEGTATFCEGQDTLVLDAGAGYQSYEWSNGDTTQTITVSESGNYTVSVIDNNGCGANISASPINVVVNVPQVPFISIFPGDTLRSSSALEYQWFFNEDTLVGETNQILYAPYSGNYTVEVIDVNGCFASSTIEYTSENASGIIDIADAGNINLYPNPGNGRFMIAAQFGHLDKASVTITNLLSQPVIEVIELGDIKHINREIDLTAVPNGVYLVEVKFGDHRYITRYVKD